MSCHIICSHRTKRISNNVGTNPFSNITYFKQQKTLKQHHSVIIKIAFVLDNDMIIDNNDDYDPIKLTYRFK